MHSKKEQFEILSRELLGKLNDVSSFSDLFFPFGYTLPVEIEEKYCTISEERLAHTEWNESEQMNLFQILKEGKDAKASD